MLAAIELKHGIGHTKRGGWHHRQKDKTLEIGASLVYGFGFFLNWNHNQHNFFSIHLL